MNLALHLASKDLRRLRWVLLAWTSMAAARVLLDTVGSTLAFTARGGELVGFLSALVSLAEFLMPPLIVSLLVHEEPLVGYDAFWLTRPIDRWALMAAKLGLIAVFLVALPVATKVIVMWAFDARFDQVLRAVPALVLIWVRFTLPFVVLAALTPSFTRFVLTLVAIVAAIMLFMTAVVAFLTFRIDEVALEASDTVYVSELLDPTAGFVGSMALITASLAVIIYQYRRRRLWRSAAFAGAGLLASVFLPGVWPWAFARPAEPDPAPWTRDASRTAATLDTEVPPHVELGFEFRRGRPEHVTVAVPVHLAGVPPNISVRTAHVRSTLHLPDGAVLRSSQAFAVSGRRSDTPPAPRDNVWDRRRAVQAVLGDVRLVTPPVEREFQMWPVVLRLRESDHQRHKATPGRLTTTIDFYLQRSTAAGSLRLVSGAVLRHGDVRFEIIDVVRRSNRCTIFLRRTTVEPLLRPPTAQIHDFVLRNRRRGEALLGNAQPPVGAVSRSVPFTGMVVFGSEPGGRGFVVDTLTLPFPYAPGRAGGDVPSLDASWLQEADLAIVVTSYAGRVGRSLTVDGFRLEK